jgi:hypothetical protein
LIFLANNMNEPALTIAHLYRCRWQVELFFKWIKQHLRIKAFYGTSPNAVKTQIWIAIAVYVLIAIVRKKLRESGLRSTAARLWVMQMLIDAHAPLTHAQVADALAPKFAPGDDGRVPTWQDVIKAVHPSVGFSASTIPLTAFAFYDGTQRAGGEGHCRPRLGLSAKAPHRRVGRDPRYLRAGHGSAKRRAQQRGRGREQRKSGHRNPFYCASAPAD